MQNKAEIPFKSIRTDQLIKKDTKHTDVVANGCRAIVHIFGYFIVSKRNFLLPSVHDSNYLQTMFWANALEWKSQAEVT